MFVVVGSFSSLNISEAIFACLFIGFFGCLCVCLYGTGGSLFFCLVRLNVPNAAQDENVLQAREDQELFRNIWCAPDML